MIKKIIYVVVLLLVLSPLAVSAADWGLAVGGSNWAFSIGSGTGGAWNLGMLSPFGLPSGSIFGIIVNILYWLLGVLGILGVIGFVIAGIMYLVSTGDETMIERAKKAMTYSLVGVIVGLIGVVIIRAISAILNAQSGF